MAPTALEPPLGLEGTLLREVAPGVVLPAAPDLPRTGELQTAVQAIVDRSTWSVVAEGTVGLDVPVLRPGGLVTIRGCGRLYNGSYLVTRVRHPIAGQRLRAALRGAAQRGRETGAELYVEVA